MKALQLSPVVTQPGRPRTKPITIEEPQAGGATYALATSSEGTLTAQLSTIESDNPTPAASAGHLAGESQGDRHAFLRCCQRAGERTWFLVAASQRVGANGFAPPLPLLRVQPGALLSIESEFWMASTLWTPEPVDVPEELAEKECPICGLPLNAAKAAECLCGNWMHLERPDLPDDEQALNCYLVNRVCGSCERPTSLEAQSIPEIPESLLQPEPDSDLH